MSQRSQDLIKLARKLVDHFERMARTPPLLQRIGSLDARLPVISDSPWHPVIPDDDQQRQEIHEGLLNSNTNLATYRNEQGALVLLRHSQGVILGREIPQAAIPVLTDAGYGVDAETATLDAAMRHSLPDFILRSAKIAKGNTTREVGDGTVLAGCRGLAVQVKAREGELRDSSREAKWLHKKAAEALKQARGTIRMTSLKPGLRLQNLRGRSVLIRGSDVDWVPVAVLEHPAPPEDVEFDASVNEPFSRLSATVSSHVGITAGQPRR